MQASSVQHTNVQCDDLRCYESLARTLQSTKRGLSVKSELGWHERLMRVIGQKQQPIQRALRLTEVPDRVIP